MAFPEIPPKSVDESVADLIQSIALEEAALAHILNAEGEKLQKIVALTEDPEDLLRFQKGLATVLQAVIKTEMLLQFKLEKVMDLIAGEGPLPTPTPPPKHHMVTK
jgi:hypothetical protein